MKSRFSEGLSSQIFCPLYVVTAGTHRDLREAIESWVPNLGRQRAPLFDILEAAERRVVARVLAARAVAGRFLTLPHVV